jgi:hypothetical protein
MVASQMLLEIKRLPLEQRLEILEEIIKDIRKSQGKVQMMNAAEELLPEYISNKELTRFTNLDFEDFYETR